MYKLIKNDGAILSTEDKARYVKMQSNGVLVLCPESEAQGLVVDNDYAVNLEGRTPIPDIEITVSLSEFNGPDKLAAVTAEGAALAQGREPTATVGILAEGFPAWEPGKLYEKAYSLFVYDGKVGFTRQANITAQEHQPPFSTGMEAIYGVRPIPDDNGIYPYVYNMKSEVGMRVRSAKDSNVYAAIQPADPLLYDPADVPALFTIEA